MAAKTSGRKAAAAQTAAVPAVESQIEDLFKTEESNGHEAGTPAPDSIENLKQRVAAKKAAQGKATAAPGSGTAAVAAVPSAAPADAGTPDGEITSQASDELAKLAAKNGDGVPDEIPGLTTSPPGNTYAETQAALATARSKNAKKKPLTAKQQATLDRQKAKEKADKEKAAAKAKAEKEKAKAREKTDKQKASEAAKKEKEKEAKDAKAKREQARKDELAKKRAEVAAKRAAAQTPDLIGRENKATQAAFAEDYAAAAPKSERNPSGQGVRRAKSDRGDFAAGWIMAMRRMRRDIKAAS